jgi:hypothetical protein
MTLISDLLENSKIKAYINIKLFKIELKRGKERMVLDKIKT